MSNKPILYSFRRCPYAMRARLALFYAGKHVELREIVLRDKPAHMVEVSPKATVPVLILEDGTVIDESLDVMFWALNANDPEGMLSPNLDEMMSLIKQTDNGDDTHFKHHLDRYKYSTRYEDEKHKELKESSKQKALLFIERLEGILSNQKQLMGNEPSLADLAIFPFVRQFANTDREFWNSLDYPHTQKWLTDSIESEAFKHIFKKLKPWPMEGQGVNFPFED